MAKKKAAQQDLISSQESSLAIETHHIRKVLREISQHFVNDMESVAVHIIELASEVPDNAKKRAALDKIIKDMQEVDVKPHKGKVGDLKRLRNLLRDTSHELEDLL
ncbi:MAG: hypothetical protein ACLFUS_07610 [Candidatus Sumerlaeia bacterium]